MMTQTKAWGQTTQLIRRECFEVHRIVIEAGGYCSRHHHNAKYNSFYVESGELNIHIFNDDSKLEDVTRLRAGDMTSVPPGKQHMFEATEKTVAYEIYWTEISDDIVRQSYGGIRGR
jgi:mannose-6-phosphate isomerase-like protein (cupin superfamily)